MTCSVREAGGGDAFAAGATIFIDDGDGRGEAGGEQQGGGVIAGGCVPLAGADEDAAPLASGSGRVPVA